MASFTRIEHETSPLDQCIDLASAALGGSIVAVSDEFFAPAINMINPAPPVHCPGRFIDTGAWMDGWETRRHNPNYDWCIIKLGFAGTIQGIDIDTSYFTGNHAPAASVEVTFCPDNSNVHAVQWTEILPRVELAPSSHNVFALDQEDTPTVYTHVRINNYPDGGIARFRAYGNVKPIWPQDLSAIVDLAFVGNGGRAVYASNEHYTPGSNLLLPGRGHNMGDGWETKRSRTPGHTDHVIIQLGAKGHILKAEIDTSHFKGNYPNRIQLEATVSGKEVPDQEEEWTVLVEPVPVGPHGLFYFDTAHPEQIFTHAKITIIPDGGLKRVRLYGIREGGILPQLPITVARPAEDFTNGQKHANGHR